MWLAGRVWLVRERLMMSFGAFSVFTAFPQRWSNRSLTGQIGLWQNNPSRFYFQTFCLAYLICFVLTNPSHARSTQHSHQHMTSTVSRASRPHSFLASSLDASVRPTNMNCGQHHLAQDEPIEYQYHHPHTSRTLTSKVDHRHDPGCWRRCNPHTRHRRSNNCRRYPSQSTP